MLTKMLKLKFAYPPESYIKCLFSVCFVHEDAYQILWIEISCAAKMRGSAQAEEPSLAAISLAAAITPSARRAAERRWRPWQGGPRRVALGRGEGFRCSQGP